MSSINHDACYHILNTVSNTIVVLVFKGLTSFVRKILQGEENKGVELAVCHGNGPGRWKAGEMFDEGHRLAKCKRGEQEEETSAAPPLHNPQGWAPGQNVISWCKEPAMVS